MRQWVKVRSLVERPETQGVGAKTDIRERSWFMERFQYFHRIVCVSGIDVSRPVYWRGGM